MYDIASNSSIIFGNLSRYPWNISSIWISRRQWWVILSSLSGGQLLTSLSSDPQIVWFFLVDRIYFCFRSGGQLMICDYRWWWLRAECNQHILWKHHRPFWDISCKYPKWYSFLNFMYSTCTYSSAGRLVCLYPFNGLEYIARSVWNHWRTCSCWDS